MCALKYLREHKLIVFTKHAQHTQHKNLSMIHNETQSDFLLSKLGYTFEIMNSFFFNFDLISRLNLVSDCVLRGSLAVKNIGLL